MLGGILGRGSFPRCKSLMKLTKNRIEVVKRKRNATLKFLREDIADLLHNGLEDNAYGRADGLLTELALSECYDFIENACDFVLRHLPALQKIKHCPEDCREAISSLMFAAARFSDLPELRDLRQLFYELYENTIDLYANRKFTEKLSTKSFTMETKLQLLKAIASEYKIDWRPDSYHKKLFVPKVPELKSVALLPKEPPRVAPQEKPENPPNGRSASGVGTRNRSALPPPYTKPNTRDNKCPKTPHHVKENSWSRQRELAEVAMIDELLMKYSTTPSYAEAVELKALEKLEKGETKSHLPPPASKLTPESHSTLKISTRMDTLLGDDDVAREKKVGEDNQSLAPTRAVRSASESSKKMTRSATFQNGTRQSEFQRCDNEGGGKEKEAEKSTYLTGCASPMTRDAVEEPNRLTRAATFQNGGRHVHPKLPDYDDLAARFSSLRGA